MQDDPVPCRSRGRYMAEDANSGEGGFHLMRPARVKRSLSPAQRLTRRMCGVARRIATHNGIGVDYFSPLKPLMRVRVDLPHPVGPAIT